MPPRKYYVVFVGRQVGIHHTWHECSAATSGFSGATFQSYRSLQEAEEAWFHHLSAARECETSSVHTAQSQAFANAPLSTTVSCAGGSPVMPDSGPRPASRTTHVGVNIQGLLATRMASHIHCMFSGETSSMQSACSQEETSSCIISGESDVGARCVDAGDYCDFTFRASGTAPSSCISSVGPSFHASSVGRSAITTSLRGKMKMD